MENYNPRQITQMRWKDAKALEHLIFKAIDIAFDENSSIKLSESSEAKQLVKHIKYCYDNQVPLIIYEYANDRVYVTTNFGSINEVYLHNLSNNIDSMLSLVYDGQDTLSISLTTETFLTATEAPKMYRHNLKFTFNVGGTNMITNGILYSSNNTDISGNNISKLNDLIKSPKSYDVLLILSNLLNDVTGVLSYDGSNFVVYYGRNPYTINTIVDKVEEA